MSRTIEILLVILGSIFVALGVAGIFLPLLPTTPFLLLGASCYIRGSQKLYQWLINNKYLGSYIRNYREGKGIPRRTKVIAIALLWLSIGFSVVFAVKSIYVRVLLLIIAACVSWHILSQKDCGQTDMAAEAEQEQQSEEESFRNTPSS